MYWEKLENFVISIIYKNCKTFSNFIFYFRVLSYLGLAVLFLGHQTFPFLHFHFLHLSKMQTVENGYHRIKKRVSHKDVNVHAMAKLSSTLETSITGDFPAKLLRLKYTALAETVAQKIAQDFLSRLRLTYSDLTIFQRFAFYAAIATIALLTMEACQNVPFYTCGVEDHRS